MSKSKKMLWLMNQSKETISKVQTLVSELGETAGRFGNKQLFSILDSTENLGAVTPDIMQDFAQWLKRPFAGTRPDRGSVGNSVDKTLEIIKELRPEKAALDGAVLFKDVPRALRSNTWDIMENLPQALKGDHAAKEYIAKLRPHELTANFKGWTSLDLVPNNPSASPLRFLFKKEADGSIKWMMRDTH